MSNTGAVVTEFILGQGEFRGQDICIFARGLRGRAVLGVAWPWIFRRSKDVVAAKFLGFQVGYLPLHLAVILAQKRAA